MCPATQSPMLSLPAPSLRSPRMRIRDEAPPPSYRASQCDGTPFDVTQRLERKLARYNASQNTLKRWLFEILSVALSALCIGAIVAILAILNNHPLGKWPPGLTIVNVLSKVASATLILPISEAIGQLKWSWFYGAKARDAFDFEIFDKASRGAWGSLLLLCRTRGRSLAALGAVLTVMLLAIDTFFQQITDLPIRQTLHGTGLYLPDFVSGNEGSQQDQSVSTVANKFFVANGTQPVSFGNGTRPDIPLSCPTGSCTWPVYDTLGMCSQCVDASQLLSYACLDTRIDWMSTLNADVSSYPNATVCGYYLNATTESPVLMSGFAVGLDGKPFGETLVMRTLPLVSNPLRDSLWGGSVNFKDVRNPIIDALVSSTLSSSQVHANIAPTLQECVLSFCIKTIKSSYELGTYQEDIISTHINHTVNNSPWSTFMYDDGSTDQTYLENVTINAPSTGNTFPSNGWGLDNITMVRITLVFDYIFPAFTTKINDTATGILRWRLGHPTEVRTKILPMNPWLLPNNITRHFERLATALTNVIRSDPSSNELVAGDAFVNETYVVVHWAWLAFPLGMLILSVIFLVATIVKTSRSTDGDLGVWKTSAMPTLMYSLPEDMRHNLKSSSAWHTTNKDESSRVRIRLVPEQGWRVSGQVRPSSVLPTSNSAHNPPGWI
ncbi:hypothetical protein HBH70_046080 [Parastagonospora nodorum]|nr:hypothetical protein HBH49_067220 [Parastagonospora nodorum]KAH4066415.1 hypothetical protein HBH50_148870 [Parastagonospora nodorum]KAH4089496.1 hypothetical protein HBH48_113970 [Parastagonospora nodorum]KAH4108700.1 hypothetical protein HBH46_037890 [Parastagonospora nodorum]KAH4212574.1 hypothetical protein HBI95_039160 [Parastagonospora nodorum]